MLYKQFLWIPLVFLLGMNVQIGERHAETNNQRTPGYASFLKYEGSIIGEQKIMLDLSFRIDSTIGLRYDCQMNLQGGFSHIVLYYKFDNPNQCILYDYIKRKKTILSGGSPSDVGPGVLVVGQELVNGYNCTHLRQFSGKKEVFNYWMSTDLPGYRSFVNVLPAFKADYAMHDINASIFKWGGLVKIRGGDPNAQLNLDIVEAIADTSFLKSDFEVPAVN